MIHVFNVAFPPCLNLILIQKIEKPETMKVAKGTWVANSNQYQSERRKECKDWLKYVKSADALLTQSEIQANCFNAFTHLITIKNASNHYI